MWSNSGGKEGSAMVTTGALRIPGYHFHSHISNLSHCGSVVFHHGYTISTQTAVIAKSSVHALPLEREFYIMKKLYEQEEGPVYVVRPLEFIHLPSGLKVAIYGHDGSDVALRFPMNNKQSTSDKPPLATHTDDGKQVASHQQPIDLRSFLKFAIQCTNCLEFIHRHGTVHGEIQPSAFQQQQRLSDRETDDDDDGSGRLKLWNFGSGAKSLDMHLATEGWRKVATNKESMEILQNMLVYISPERTGRTTYPATYRSDIYSLGIMFHVILTGQYPFEGGPIEIISSVISRKIPPAHELRQDVPVVLSQIIKKMTNKAPDDRYASAHGVKADLTECLIQLQASAAADGVIDSTGCPSNQLIKPFPLARHDVASCFTLPKTTYGRQKLVYEVTSLVQSYMTQYNSVIQPKLVTSAPEPSPPTEGGWTPHHHSHDTNEADVRKLDTASTKSSHTFSSYGTDTTDLSTTTTAATTVRRNRHVLSTNRSAAASSLVANKQVTRIIGLFGPGGIGKSTIFTAVQITARKYGYVATAKFDSRKKIPYGGFIEALSQILQQILSEPQYRIEAFSSHLKDSLKEQLCNIHLMFELVPELAPFMAGGDVNIVPLPNTESYTNNIGTQVRFQNVFVELLRHTSSWYPVTIFLDDVHLSDGPSLELIQALIASRVRILLCIAYREKEVTEKLRQVLTNDGGDIYLLRVGALGMADLIDLVCDTLHRSRRTDRQSVMPLAKVLYKRTSGNAFYVTQLLQAFERKKYIYFDWERNMWDFVLDAIEKSDDTKNTFTQSSSIDTPFLVARLQELPKTDQDLLRWASFVGDTFSWHTVRDLILTSTSSSSWAGEDVGGECIETDIGSDDGSSSEDNTSCHHLSIGFHHPSLMKDSDKATKPPRMPRKHMQITTHDSTRGNRQQRYQDAMTSLQSVLQEGYIVPTQGDEFKWAHDRLSHAAMELADPRSRGQIHLTIAQHLMRDPKIDPFLVADHLLKCEDLVSIVEYRESYRDILITAGNRSRASGAHSMSFSYYMGAIRLGDREVEWNDANYASSLNLYTNAASLSWIVGEYDQTDLLLATLFRYSRNALDRLSAFHIQSSYYSSRQMHEQGLATLLDCLEDLGYERFTCETTDDLLAKAYEEADILIKTIGMDNIVHIGVCDDPVLLATMAVLEEMCTVAYWLGNKKEMYALACRIFKLSMTKGMTNVSGIAFVFMGLGYVELYKQFSYGEIIGSIGVSLSEQHSTNYEIGRTYFLYGIFLLPWKRVHQRVPLQWFETAMPISLSAGDRIYASYSQVHIAASMLTLGYNLNDAARHAKAAFEDTKSWSSSINTTGLSQCLIRTIKALQGLTYTDTPNVFDGDDGFCDQDFITKSYYQATSNPEVPLSWYESYKIMPLVLYGHSDEAIQVGYRCLANIDSHPCHKHVAMMMFYFSLALIEKLRSTKCMHRQQQLDYRNQIGANQGFLSEWATHSPINYLMYWTMVEAERATLEPLLDVGRVGHLYEKAIDQAREGAWIIEMCVMNEFAGGFYDRCGLHNVAYGFIRKAISLYKDHGSYGKVRHLGMKYHKLLERYGDHRHILVETGVQTDPFPYLSNPSTAGAWKPSPLNANNGASVTTTTNRTCVDLPISSVTAEQTLATLDIIDMASILRSSQVMSSEVNFDGLLKAMMSIILESTGAASGAIIVNENGYGICAYGSQESGITTYDPPRTLCEDNNQLSTHVIHHTLRTKEGTFVDNITEDQRFATGPWFDRVGTRSVMCMPIVHKSNILGCVFMEGTVGVFNHRHVTVLGLLCQQMGISITNATLFKSVQLATTANIKMIEMQKQALLDARRSKEEADRATRLREMFLANMSHEIRTPFSGFYGMISLLAETNLDPEQRDLVKVSKESCEILLRLIDDLLNFSKLQAGKVSLELLPVSIEDVIADVIEMLTAMAIQKKINISHIIEVDVPPVIIADANRLRQVIINLLGNAIKFTHEGEVVIRCSVDKSIGMGRRDQKDNKIPLLFEVIDSGIGISEEQQKSLFLPFSQVDGSTTRKYGGTGLGLSICLQLVELMGGKINVTSVPKKGSNFYFTIPAERACEPSTRNEENVRSLVSKVKGVRVLVAGKHESTISMIQSLLGGLTVDGANTVDELRSYNPEDYHIVVVGIFLAHDPEFEAWSTTLNCFTDRVGCVLVIHYPSGVVAEWLGKSYLTIDNAGATDATGDGTADVRSNRISTSSSNDGSQKKERLVVRMSIPLRRQKILQTLVDITEGVIEQQPKPAQVKVEKKAIKKNVSSVLATDTGSQFKGMNILIAEDNVVAQKLLYKQLTRMSLNVVCANNGREAVEAWEKYPAGFFKMGFFDHHMPKCDGLQATAIIRKLEAKQPPHATCRLPIVAVTADIQESAREACMKAGMDGYLTKPLNQKVLHETLLYYCKTS